MDMVGSSTTVLRMWVSIEVLNLSVFVSECKKCNKCVVVVRTEVVSRNYTPAKDRQRPHMLEMMLRLPPLSTVTITIQFSRGFLKWTEHPPDAHHGFYIK